jgi:hypothetical protein
MAVPLARFTNNGVQHRLLGLCACCLIVTSAGVCRPVAADASQLIDRNATHVTLAVNGLGEAMVSYQKAGLMRHVLAWGAVNAIAPTADSPQVAFRLDYSGGFGKYHRLRYWQAPNWVCLPTQLAPVAWMVAACKAPDNTYWALQAWQRALPDLGVAPNAEEATTELRLSHWRGALPVLSITLDWSYRRFRHLFGTFTYAATGVYGFHSTSSGVPLDSFGRNIYLDTRDSAYGAGWRRENSFLTHGPRGSFCYGFYAHGARPTGDGTEYRATVIGPGVTPDAMWQGRDPGPYDAATDAMANALERRIGDPNCTA